MNPVYVHGVGLTAPGLPDWDSGQAVLRGQTPYQPAPLAVQQIQLLPRNEARRAGASVRLAFQVAEQASAGTDRSQLATVFASSAADTSIADRICSDLASAPRSVSPTQFHNSVHNTAGGYWGIATGSTAPSNSISAGQDSFALALQEAWAMLAFDARPVLLVCFDAQGSGMLDAARPSIAASCALALLLSATSAGALARLSSLAPASHAPSLMPGAELERLRHHNPAGRGLALLQALAQPGPSQVVIESSQGNLALNVEQLA